MPWFSAERLSVIRQTVTSARRKVWFCAQRFRITRQLRSSEPIDADVARRRDGIGEGDRERHLLAVHDAQSQVALNQRQHAVRIAGQALRVLGAVKRVVRRQGALEVGLHVAVSEGKPASAVVR